MRWNKSAYAVYDVDVEDPGGRLILRDNMWDHGWCRSRQEYDGDADAYVLDCHAEAIKEYFDTGMTYLDWCTLERDQILTVPSRKISLADVRKYHTINVHLGKGREGARRLTALRTLAAEAGYYWNNEPSIGRWLSAVADGKFGTNCRSGSTTDLEDKVRVLAREQFEMWQALIKGLE